MLRRFGDLIFIYAFGVLAVVISAVVSPLKAFAAIPLVLFVPGYALVKAFFLDREVKLPERLLSSVGLSIALTILGGMLLNLTTWGLQGTSFSLFLGLITIVATSIAILKRIFRPRAHRNPIQLKFDEVGFVLLFLAALLVYLSVGLARLPSPAKDFQGYTLLWILPAENSEAAYRVGLENDEFSLVHYRLQIDAGGETVVDMPSIPVDRGERWEQVIEIPADRQNRFPVVASLFREDESQDAYRTVSYWP